MEEEKEIPSGERRRKPDEGVVRVRWEGGSLMASHDCNVSLLPPATMANASAKKTAANNEQPIHNLRQGLLIATTLSMLIRIIFRTKSLSPAQLSFWIHIISHIPPTLIARYLSKIGEPKRSPTGELISPGEDLNQPGVIEWAFDIIYVTCKRVPNSPTVIF
jgi:hypothetical protein